jgi:hypothetical protein
LRLHRPNVISLLGAAMVAAAGALLVGTALVADARWFDAHWLELYCAVSPATYAGEWVARAIAAIAGLGLVVAALSVVPRWIGGRDPARLGRSAASIVLAMLLALLTSDAILRRRARRRNDVVDEPTLPPMIIDATGNFAPVPGRTRSVALGPRHVEYAIDSDGNRSASADRVADVRAPSLLFAGESITIGWGVPYEKTYPAIVGAALRLQSINLAVARFSNDQAYLRLRDALDRFERPVAVVTLVIASQVARNVSRQRDRLVLSNGRLELLPASKSWVETSPLLDLFFHSDEAIPLTRAILLATAEAARVKGARAIFVWTNFGPPCIAGDRGESPLENALFDGTPHVRVDITPDEYIVSPGDPHPNEAGHMAIARALLAALAPPDALSR